MRFGDHKIISNQTLHRFIRFGLVGGSGVFVDMGALFILVDPHMLGWGLSVSKTLAAEVAIVNNFIWNDIWTFGDFVAQQVGWSARLRRFAKFNLICLVGVGINVALLNLQVHVFHLNIYVANFIAIGLVCIWNFWMNLKFGWANSKNEPFSKLGSEKDKDQS